MERNADILACVDRVLRGALGVLPGRDSLVVGVSGGADSVVLLHVLQRLGYVVHAVHCNFHLRGDESERDERFVRDLCRVWEIALDVIPLNTMDYASAHHISIEMAAREQRYAAFETIRVREGAIFTAVAHHRDDQVETLLLNLVRGTGVRGLCGIRLQNGTVVRPLLELGREDILAYAEAWDLRYVTDSTNLQTDFCRNKVRLQVLPLLAEINPAVRQVLLRMSHMATETYAVYEQTMQDWLRRLIHREGDAEYLAIADVRKSIAPCSLLYEWLSPKGFRSSQVNQILTHIEGDESAEYRASSWRLIREYDRLMLYPMRENNEFHSLEITGPGEYRLNCGGCLLVEEREWTVASSMEKAKDVAYMDADCVLFPFTLRSVRQGDSFVPFGMKGHKLVSDYLTDIKMPRIRRERQYVLCSDKRIVWLVGERLSAEVAVRPGTHRVWLLRWIPAEM